MKLLKDILKEKYGDDYPSKLCFWDTCIGEGSITIGTFDEFKKKDTGYDYDITIPFAQGDFSEFMMCTIEEAEVRGLIIA